MMTALRRLLLFTSTLLCVAAPLRAQSNVAESAAFAFDTRDYTTGLAAESATFAFDTRLVDGQGGNDVSVSFVFDTRGTTTPPLQITGVLRDSAGVPVAGATIQIKRAGTVFWQGVTGAGGTFTAPSLSGVNYTVVVTKAGYVTSITNPGGAAGGSQTLNITLQPLPSPPSATAVSRSLTGTEIRPKAISSDPDFPVLLRYNGSQLVTDMTGLDPSRMTVVISHGWVPKDFSDFATALDWTRMLAIYINNHHAGLPTAPNILVWDWRQKAFTHFVPTDAASEVGLDLGRKLQEVLGANYSQHVHFIGHSLGTIVNRYACEHVHKSLTGYLSSENPATGWNSSLTSPHVTLLDEAELGVFGSTTVLTSSALAFAAANLGSAILIGSLEAKKDWKYPIPRNASWVDNYISLVGLQHADAINVCLPGKVLGSTNPVAALLDGHSYAHEWYRDSVNPAFVGAAPPSVGYLLSVEGGGNFPPSGTGLTNGSYWQENLNTADPLDLTYFPSPIWNQANIALAASLGVATTAPIIQPLDALGKSVLNGYQASIQWAGNIGGTAIVKTGQVITATKEKVGLWFDAAWDKASDVVNSVNFDTPMDRAMTNAVFGLQLQSGAAAFASASGTSDAAPTPPAQPPYAWVTVAVPADASQMAFDFTVTGNPVEDRIACAVNGENLFTLPAKFAETGEPMSTDMMDVSAYAGQTIEVFVGLAGGTSTNCQVAIDGLRFITVPTPKVGVAVSGNDVTVKWPAAASGWVLEYSDTLTPGSWQAVPLDGGTALQSGVLSISDAVAGPKAVLPAAARALSRPRSARYAGLARR